MPDIGFVQPVEILLPAASQGAIGIECRGDDAATLALVAAVDHDPTHRAVAAERAFLAALGGDCRSPVAAHARFLDDGTLRLDRSEEHTSELQSLMRHSYSVFCLTQKNNTTT